MVFIRRWFGPLAVLLVLAVSGGYWFYWNALAEGLVEGVERTQRQWQKHDTDLTYAAVEVTGFPYRLELRLTAPEIALPKQPGQAVWRTEELVIYFQPWKLGHAIAETKQPVQVAWTEGTVRRNAEIRSSSNRASVVVGPDGRWQRFNTDTQDVEIAGSLALKKATSLQAHGRRVVDDRGDRSLDLAVRGEGITIDPGSSPFGKQLDLFRLTLGFEPEPASQSADDLEVWRRSGGVMQMRALEFVAGDLSVTGNGTFAIDENRQPEGASTLTIRGAEAFVDAISAAGQLSSGARIGLRLGITALEKQDSSGDKVVQVPVTLQDGKLGLMGIGLVSIPPLY